MEPDAPAVADTLVEEPDGPSAQPAAVADPECVAWVKAKLHLPGLKDGMFTPEHDETIAEFVVSTTGRRLIAFIDSVTGLSLSLVIPQVPFAGLPPPTCLLMTPPLTPPTRSQLHANQPFRHSFSARHHTTAQQILIPFYPRTAGASYGHGIHAQAGWDHYQCREHQ